MWTKRTGMSQMGVELIGYMITSACIAGFSFVFLNLTSLTVADKLISEGEYDMGQYADTQFFYWLKLTCIAAAMVVFFAFFLLLSGQKIAYILSISAAVQRLQQGELDYRVELVGEDELSELANAVNGFAEELQRHTANEQRLHNEKNQLVRSLSHDIRTPLTAIISYSDFIKNHKYESAEQLVQFSDTIQSKANQIKELSDALLNLDGVQARNTERVMDGKLMLEQLAMEFISQLEMEGFSVELNIESLPVFDSMMEANDLIRIFDNLYSNIVKYADCQDTVLLKVEIERGTLYLRCENKVRNGMKTKQDSHGIGLESIGQLAEKYSGAVQWGTYDNHFYIKISLSIA